MNAAQAALEALTARGWTLGIAESLTGGALCAAFVSIPGASTALLGGVIAYATPVKHTLLGVDAELLAAYGPVHGEVAVQMAAGARRAVRVGERNADVGVSTTGIAGPKSPDGQPVGTVHIGISTPFSSSSRAFRFDGDRQRIRAQTVEAALRMIAAEVGE